MERESGRGMDGEVGDDLGLMRIRAGLMLGARSKSHWDLSLHQLALLLLVTATPGDHGLRTAPKALGSSRGAVARALAGLERRGLAQFATAADGGPDDRILPTERGRALVQEVAEEMNKPVAAASPVQDTLGDAEAGAAATADAFGQIDTLGHTPQAGDAEARGRFVDKRSATPVDVEVGRRIREYRVRSGITLHELAQQIGVSSAQLSRYEIGLTRVAASRLVAIASALGVAVDALIKSAGAEPTPRFARAAPDVGELLSAFSNIARPERRSALIALAKSMAQSEAARRL